ncbi:DHA2 family efflux MFS transporter permease subunit [Nakamurella antarctica]|uniref:DHA2 family efflux MFS transporter permease subunit n=1 Tax=Nakamurella antarctica TaxID=1902245 RepID=A0A3G8ZPB7_9ACTN|nr:MFS transporter [Nakamurella antarctica]AZI59123.1 DHA2 family efflux MFS transporter permease subunit [Nakamurella antarctica]
MNAKNPTLPGLVLRSKQGRLVLWSTVLASGMALLDGSVVNVALPRIGRDLSVGLTSLQWMVNAYTLTLSGLLLLGGSLGDRMGRRKIFLFGVVWFAIASLGCALSPTGEVLIGMRAVQGVGAALLTPGSLAILEAVFRKEDRAEAVGSWSGLGGIAAAAGPLLGGVLVGVAPWGWRLIFLLNLPIAAAVVWIGSRAIPENRDDGATGKLDISGAALAAIGLAGVTYALTEGPATGWPPVTVACAALGVAILAGFVINEKYRQAPMMPLELFAAKQFSAANAVTFAVYAALAGTFFILPLRLQQVSGFSPLLAGTCLLPTPILMLLFSARMGRLATRIGPRIPMTVGPIVSGCGIYLMSILSPDTSFGWVVLAVTVFSTGLTVTVAPLTSTVLGAAPPARIGVASAVNNGVARVAGLLAVAALPAVVGITTGVTADRLALAADYSHALLISAVLCAGGGALAFFTISNGKRA